MSNLTQWGVVSTGCAGKFALCSSTECECQELHVDGIFKMKYGLRSDRQGTPICRCEVQNGCVKWTEMFSLSVLRCAAKVFLALSRLATPWMPPTCSPGPCHHVSARRQCPTPPTATARTVIFLQWVFGQRHCSARPTPVSHRRPTDFYQPQGVPCAMGATLGVESTPRSCLPIAPSLGGGGCELPHNEASLDSKVIQIQSPS